LAHQTKNPLKKNYVSFLAKRLKKAECKALNSVDVVVPITENDASYFKAELPNLKMHVTPAGIDLKRWIFKPTNKILNWYHIGAMDWMPNLDAVKWFLDEIHPNILKILDGYQFHLAGKNMPNDLKKLNKQGVLVYQEVLDSVQFCLDKDVCVVPLRAGSGIRIKILEAMSAGKLVISSSVGIQGINVKENEHFLLANTIQDYLNLIEKFRASQINVETIVNNARQYIEKNYSTDSVCQSLLRFYQNTLQESGKTVENNIE
jgi:glycosyltransferase involved in cell wall biosynthesis